jgi:hypothetical protein
MTGVGIGTELVAQQSVMELAVSTWISLLMALGEIGFGWLLVSRSESMSRFFNLGTRFARGFVIAGWISLVGGCLTIATFLFLVVFIAFQSLRS